MVNVKKTTIALLFIFFVVELMAENRWAVVIGIDEYPQMGTEFPYIVNGISDAKKIAQKLSISCKFPKDHIYLLTGENARSDWVREVIFRRLSHSKPDDLVVFFFMGHAYRDPDLKRRYLLFYDSYPNLLDTTAIPLDQLAYFFESYVPARNIAVFLDARHSPQSLGDSWRLSKEWAAESEKQLLLFESSAYYEIFGRGRKKGDFADFFVDSLNGRDFLGKNADSDGDGLITVTEQAKHVSVAMSLSNISHPQYWGECNSVLAATSSKPYIQLLEPKIFKASPQIEHRLAGFLRCEFPLKNMEIAGIPAKFGLLSKAQARKYGVLPWAYSYWFSTKQSIALGQSSLPVRIIGENSLFDTDIPLHWSYPGWYGEWMPSGLKKGNEGVYLWEKDDSEMIYVPAGNFIMGMPAKETAKIISRWKQMLNYFQEQHDWLKNDRALREIFIGGLEESNATLTGVARKLKIIYDQVELFQKVNSQVISPQKTEESEIENSPTSLLQEQLFVSLSDKLILRCYRDIRTIISKQKELEQDIAYIKELIAMGEELPELWPRKKIELPGFYIDRYEVSNGLYRKFCDATARAYPPSPWWNEDYFFEYPNHPVVDVSWYDAMAYARWAGKTLPDSAHWEKSACGDKGWAYPWGNHEPDQTLVNADVLPKLSSQSELQLPRFMPVAVSDTNYASSPYGCYHMAGNVREWCLDTPGRIDKKFSAKRISKGGAFSTCSAMLFNWFSYPSLATTRRCNLGFRCSLPPLAALSCRKWK